VASPSRRQHWQRPVGGEEEDLEGSVSPSHGAIWGNPICAGAARLSIQEAAADDSAQEAAADNSVQACFTATLSIDSESPRTSTIALSNAGSHEADDRLGEMRERVAALERSLLEASEDLSLREEEMMNWEERLRVLRQAQAQKLMLARQGLAKRQGVSGVSQGPNPNPKAASLDFIAEGEECDGECEEEGSCKAPGSEDAASGSTTCGSAAVSERSGSAVPEGAEEVMRLARAAGAQLGLIGCMWQEIATRRGKLEADRQTEGQEGVCSPERAERIRSILAEAGDPLTRFSSTAGGGLAHERVIPKRATTGPPSHCQARANRRSSVSAKPLDKEPPVQVELRSSSMRRAAGYRDTTQQPPPSAPHIQRRSWVAI